MAVIGKNFAILSSGRIKLAGIIPWFIWAFIHIMFLPQAAESAPRTEPMVWSYFTGQRSSRLVDVGAADLTQTPESALFARRQAAGVSPVTTLKCCTDAPDLQIHIQAQRRSKTYRFEACTWQPIRRDAGSQRRGVSTRMCPKGARKSALRCAPPERIDLRRARDGDLPVDIVEHLPYLPCQQTLFAVVRGPFHKLWINLPRNTEAASSIAPCAACSWGR